MFLVTSFRRTLTGCVLMLFALAGCSRELARPVAPVHESQTGVATRDVATMDDARAPGVAADNIPPSTLILDPPPGGPFTPTLTQPVTIRWTGEDPDGHLHEYRYRVFGRHNPDFREIENFLSFLYLYPDSVLSFYAPDFAGWDVLRVRHRSPPPSATYQLLTPENTYAFAVVAIDNRRDHDPILVRGRNVLEFGVNPDAGPDLTFVGPFGEVTGPEWEPVVVPAGAPVTVHWFATPRPGMVIEGYRSSIDQWPPADEPSLEDTTATLSPPRSGFRRLLYVEVQYDQGLRSVHILSLEFTGSALAASPRPALRR